MVAQVDSHPHVRGDIIVRAGVVEVAIGPSRCGGNILSRSGSGNIGNLFFGGGDLQISSW